MNQLRQAREEKGLSQTALTVLTGISQNTISDIENGKIFVYTGWKKRLAEALELPEEELFPENQGVK